jgi:hypothetical protein
MLIPAYLSATASDGADYANRISALTRAQWTSLNP